MKILKRGFAIHRVYMATRLSCIFHPHTNILDYGFLLTALGTRINHR